MILAALLALPPLVACSALLNFSPFDSQYGAATGGDASDDTAVPTTCDAAFNSDPLNCGRCDHSCLGGVCLAMQCQPVTLAPVNAGTTATSIALDPDQVYWSDTPGIMAVAKDGGMLSTIAPLAAAEVVSDIAVDTSGLYWGADGNGSTGSGLYSLADGGPILLQSGAITSLTLDNSYVYWTSPGIGSVRRASKSGNDVSDIVEYPTGTSYEVGHIIVGSSLLYWTNTAPQPNVNSAPAAGCIQGPSNCGTALAPASTSVPNGLIVDDGGIFWSTSGGISQTALDGGLSSSVYASTGGGIRALAADADTFYLAIGLPPQILSVSRAQRSPALVANLSNDEVPLAIAVDDVAIYFVSAGVTQGNIGVGDGGRVGRIAK